MVFQGDRSLPSRKPLTDTFGSVPPKGCFGSMGSTVVSTQELSPGSAPLTGVLGLLTDGSGTLWVRTQGSILRRRNGEFEDVTSELEPRIFHQRDESIERWRHSAVEPEIRRSAAWQKIPLIASHRHQSLKTALVMSIAQSPDGKIWLGTRADGLFYVNNGQISLCNSGAAGAKNQFAIADE